MTDSLISSADFSDLSDMVDDLIVSTPVCPICRNNFSRRVKPMTVQPCGHSLCSSCLTELDSHIQLDEDGRPIPSKCPTCRGAIEKSTPNWSLREITCNVNNDQVTGFWEKQIIGLDIAKGRKIAFSREMRPYAKVICMRIAYDEVIVNIKLGPGDWTREQIEAMQSIKNGFIKAVNRTNDDMDVIFKWIGILAFPIVVETYLLKFFVQWYDNKEFLEEIGGMWLMDVITHPV